MRRSLSLILLLLFTYVSSQATHLRSGEIEVRQQGINSLTVRIKITVFTNTRNTNVLFGGEDDILDFGDGHRILVPETPNTLRPDLGDGIAQAEFIIFYTYAQMGQYVISYSEPNRNEGIVNMDASVNTRFFIETMIHLRPNALADTPFSLVPPINYAAQGNTFSLSLAYTDTLGNRLIYEKAVPKRSAESFVINYRYPENYLVDRYTGTVTWDTKFQQDYLSGEYAFAVKISQVDEDGKIVGYVLRDFQIILEETEGNVPAITDDRNLDQNNRIYTPPGRFFVVRTMAKTDNVHPTTLSAFSELSMAPNAYTFSVEDSTIENGTIPVKVGKLVLSNIPSIRRDAPYPITVRASVNKNGTIFTSDIAYLFFTNDVPTEVEVEGDNGLPVGVMPEVHESLKVYPNPFVDYFSIESDFSEDAVVIVKDMRGREVYHRQFTGGEIDLSQLAAAPYVVFVVEGGRRSVARVMKR